jgi:hypothetical protein
MHRPVCLKSGSVADAMQPGQAAYAIDTS